MPPTIIEDPDPSEIPSRALRDFLERWRAMTPDDRAKSDPLMLVDTFSDHIPYIAINLHDADQDRFRVSFYGSEYAIGTGGDRTGFWVDEIDSTGALLERYRWLMREGKPYVALGVPLEWSVHDYKAYNVIGCPLRGKDDRVRGIIFRIEFVQ